MGTNSAEANERLPLGLETPWLARTEALFSVMLAVNRGRCLAAGLLFSPE